ncbi:hypothetical protein [Microbacterium sp. TNHR37B]|uniref:hypothetical protein n=1 Tax=Microbacterium sp. TNHR37B TaxID=1775956 RepID=UPI0007B1FBFC|nr:hypothetical protein [Microbacterium sp. TNHR37B]KZE88612.1 hypothetical protein AVP41_03118 [Microbacterium sp. TNHR37B]
MRAWRGVGVLALVALLSGCSALSSIPTDPDGSLDRITGGTVRVGVTDAPGLVEMEGDRAAGPLADLVVGFAEERDARVQWTAGSEEELVDRLETGDLDLAIGGMTEETPWLDRASVTRGYDGIPGAAGRRIVVLLPLGENGLQSALEAFLDERVGP